MVGFVIDTKNIRDGFRFDPIEVEPDSDIASLLFVENANIGIFDKWRFMPVFYNCLCGTKARLDRSNGLIDQYNFKELGWGLRTWDQWDFDECFLSPIKFTGELIHLKMPCPI